MSIAGIGLLLGLAGLAFQFLATLAWGSQRVRMAMPVPVETSEVWLIVIGLVCEVVGGLLMAF